MSYQVFARKYRPKTFDDILGQDHVVRTLKNAITEERLAHAYLFVGPRGTGKTSTARILSKALNCPGGPRVDFNPNDDICIEIAEGTALDVLEIDGASNNGVDEVRALRETVRFAPACGQFKIYYIDEVHMLSKAAFNALLKTLEEPPDHVKFIFATTEPHKILPTILSRCQRFDLRPIPIDTIATHLLHIAREEGITLDDSAAWAIAKGADGGMRDAQSMLDQLVAFCGNSINEANVLDIFGFTSRETVAALITALLARDTPAALKLVQREADAGRELSQLLGELIGLLRTLLVAGLDPNASTDGIPEETWQTLTKAATGYHSERLLSVIEVFAEAEDRMRWATNKRLHLELGIIKAIQTLGEVRLTDVIRTLTTTAELLPIASPPAAKNPETTPQPTPNPTPIPEPSPEPSPEPKPKPPNPSAPSKPPSTSNDDFGDIDQLIDAAPKASEQAPPPAQEPAPKPKGEPETPQSQALDRDDFYNDPLIKKATKIFRATRK